MRYVRFFHDILVLIKHIQYYFKKMEGFKNFDKTNERLEEHIKIIDEQPPSIPPKGGRRP